METVIVIRRHSVPDHALASVLIVPSEVETGVHALRLASETQRGRPPIVALLLPCALLTLAGVREVERTISRLVVVELPSPESSKVVVPEKKTTWHRPEGFHLFHKGFSKPGLF